MIMITMTMMIKKLTVTGQANSDEGTPGSVYDN